MDYLLLHDADYLEPIVAFTTRAARSGERHGKDYYFISRSLYTDLRVKGEILEEIEYLEHHYGITREELNRVQKTGKNGLAVLSLEGLRILKSELMPQNIVSIYIYRDLKDIIQTIKENHSEESKAQQKINLAKTELLDIGTCDYVVYNTGSLAEAYQQISQIIKKEINAPPIEREIAAGQRYRHFKGDIYEIITTALHSENYCPMVVYRNITTGATYARPYDLFCGKKELKSENRIVNRFELVEEREGEEDSPN